MTKWKIKNKRFIDRRSRKLCSSKPKRRKKARGHVNDLKQLEKKKVYDE